MYGDKGQSVDYIIHAVIYDFIKQGTSQVSILKTRLPSISCGWISPDYNTIILTTSSPLQKQSSMKPCTILL